MVRSFKSDPVDAELIDQILELAIRAPSAGNTWGTHFVVLEGVQTQAYWNVTLPPNRRAEFRWPGLLMAPVIVLPCGDESAYLARYSEPDKARSGLGASVDAWAVPYWHVDTAMAAMTLLYAATDVGLGALFFGVFDHESAVCEAFEIPAGVRPIGAIALGWPAEGQRKSRSAQRGRAPIERVVHRGIW